MMTRTEAMQILSQIFVDDALVLKACNKMNFMIDESIRCKAYKKQGGTMFKFNDGAVAWITVWMFGGSRYYNLTERGETFYIGVDGMKCAEMLCKLGIAHRQVKSFMGCA